MTVRLAVVGIGQQMRHDDAVGLEAVQLWQRTHASTAQLPEIAVSLVEEPGLELLGLLEGMDGAVIVDAVRSGSAAGTLHHIEVEDLAAYSEAVASAHNWGVAEVLRLGGHTGPQLTAAPDQTDRHRSITDWIWGGSEPCRAIRPACHRHGPGSGSGRTPASLRHAGNRRDRRARCAAVFFLLWYISGTLERGSMKINYQETAKDLLVRIDIHEKYGARNIDQWTVDVLRPVRGMRILDVGCGAGKQCFLYSDSTNRQASIVGGDFSNELLERARAKNAERGDEIEFRFLDFNKAFEFPSELLRPGLKRLRDLLCQRSHLYVWGGSPSPEARGPAVRHRPPP